MIELKKPNEKLQKLLQRKARIESDLARAQKAAKDALRRDETRRKIVLGGALLKGIESGRIREEIGHGLISTFVSERDKKLFEDFTFKAPVNGAENRE